MKVQDFFSIVQLGVGIHAGTAILQLSGELGVAPVERRVSALEKWIAQEDQRDFKLEDLADSVAITRTSLTVFKIKYDRSYKTAILATFGFGVVLAVALAIMSFIADKEASLILSIILVLFCFCPAAAIFAHLWFISSKALKPIQDRLTAIEDEIRSPDR